MPIPPLTGDSPLRYVRKWLRHHVEDGTKCPCCGQLAKVYRRTIHAAMAVGAIRMLKAGAAHDYVHLPTVLAGYGGGDVPKLRYWGLIEESPEQRPDGSNRVGWWRLTALGVRWAQGRTSVPKYVRIYDGRCLGVEGPNWTVQDALGQRFHYEQLMAGT